MHAVKVIIGFTTKTAVIMQIRHLKFKKLLLRGKEVEESKKNCYNGTVIILHLCDLAETLFQDKAAKCHTCYGMEYAIEN